MIERIPVVALLMFGCGTSPDVSVNQTNEQSQSSGDVECTQSYNVSPQGACLLTVTCAGDSQTVEELALSPETCEALS